MKPNVSTRYKDIFFTAIAVAALVLLAIWLISQRPAVEIPPGNNRFGIAFINGPDHPADEIRYNGALATGARWNRWPLYWHWIAEGGYLGRYQSKKYDYDALVSQDLAHGLTPIVILIGTPGQYAARPEQPEILDQSQAGEAALLTEHISTENMAIVPPQHLDKPIFADGSDEAEPGKPINPANVWANFVYRSVERYRPGGLLAQQRGWPEGVGVRYWEVWNEPDYRLFWKGTVVEYRRLLEVAYKTIKATDPEATVILGGLAFYDQPNWFIDLLRQSAGAPERAYFDVLSFHHYLSIYNSENRLVESRAALDSYGLSHAPIWITESGVSVWDDYPALVYEVPANEPLRATMAEQAAYIIQNAALSFYNGVERYYHFMLHDDCGDSPSSAYGLRQNFTPHACNPAQGQRRPAYSAYQLAAQQFHDLVPLWRQKLLEQDQLAFYRESDRARVMALWATTGLTVTAAISATGDTARLYWIESPPPASNPPVFSRTSTLTPTNGIYTLTLLPATNQNSPLPDDPTYQIGGPPYLLVEQDTQPPIVELMALPPSSPEHILVRWQGQDEGSGIAAYDVLVNEDGGPFQPWLTGVTTTQANYSGQAGHSYSFIVIARDRAGNKSSLPATIQAATQVVPGLPVSGVVLGPDNEGVPQATVVISGPNTEEQLTANEQGEWGPVGLLAGDYSFQASGPNELYFSWPAPRQIPIETATKLTLTLASPANAVLAGDFEEDEVWSRWDWSGEVNRSVDAFDGQFGVRLGDGLGEPVACPQADQPGQLWAVRQEIVAPAESPQLSFMVKISTPQAGTVDSWLEVSLWRGSRQHQLVPPGELGQATDWRLATIDVPSWRGQTVDLEFQVIRCSDQPFSVTLDRISLGQGKN